MPPEPAEDLGRGPQRGWPPGLVAGPADREALLVLSHLDGVTPRRLHALAWRKGSASRCLRAVLRGPPTQADRARAVDPDAALAALAACGARLVCPADDEFADRLLDLPDPPAWLFVRGGSLERVGVAVAIVGARSCTPYGRELASTIGRGLAGAGVTVVSGAAIGIDAAAHRGALEGTAGLFDGEREGTREDADPRRAPPGRGSEAEPVLPTLAILGSGIDVAHPPRNRGLLSRIASVGAVASEYPPGVPALPWRFPARNRLVAAMGTAVLIVEGAEGSGSMITAEFAMDLGRDVLAVPGAVTSPLSTVPHALIRDGAGLVRGVDDVLEALGLAPAGAAPRDGTKGEPSATPIPGLSSAERRVLDGVAGPPLTVDAVAQAAGLSVRDVLPALVALELRGLVRGVAGRYERTVAAPTQAAPADR